MKVTKQYPVGAPLYDEWWDDVLRTENPAPVNQAFDRLRERVGTDDTGELKRGLYRAAGERMLADGKSRGICSRRSMTESGCTHLGNGQFDAAWGNVRRFYAEVDPVPVSEGRETRYLRFSKEFKRVLDLCYELESLP